MLTVAAVIMDGSKTKTKTMSETKLRSKTATSSGKTKTTRSALSATARDEHRARRFRGSRSGEILLLQGEQGADGEAPFRSRET